MDIGTRTPRDCGQIFIGWLGTKELDGRRRTADDLPNINKKNDTNRPVLEHIPGLDDYELKPHYDLDYSKAEPNRFAGKVQFTHGGARKNAGRNPAPEQLVSKRIYRYPRHVKLLEKVDKNMSAAIRKLVDATEKN